ncbi:MAG: pitrilysin family protein [Candidatus Magasanikbacteria bacterium]|nr:pitrilysin family protein [Candidatus Magasanikbacteria bacterium]
MYSLNTLKNGLKLITAPMNGTKTATILVMVGTGSKYERRENSGISHFLEHMFFKGTTKRPTCLALSAELDSLGAEFNAFTSKEYTGYWVKVDAKKIEQAMDIVSDMLLNSKMSAVEIEREKGVIIEELNMYEDNPMMHIDDVFENCLYGDCAAGWDTIGTKKNINGFKREDFIDYLESQYNEKNTIVCLAGNIDAKAKKKIEKYFDVAKFAKRGKNFQEKEVVIEKQAKPKVMLEYKKTDQAHLCLGVRSCDYNDKDKTIAKMIGIILGGSMSSRLFINLRERHGLAYYVHAGTEVYTDSGYLAAAAGVPVDKIEKAIEIILAEFKKIKTTLVPAKELQRTKDLLSGKMAIQMESSDSLANWYARQAVLAKTVERLKTDKKDFLKDNISEPDKYLKIINKITADDIRRVARDIFVEKNLNLAVIGPFMDGKRFEDLMSMGL